MLAHQELHHTLTEQAVLARTSSSPNGQLGPEVGLPFIVKLWYSFHDTHNLYLVMDFHPGGDLATQLARWGRLGTDRARFYAAEIAEGVEALHGAGIIYRDLKPENVLIGADGHIVLSDFGLSKEFPRPGVEARSPHWLLPSDSSSKHKHGDKVPKDPPPPETTTTFCGTAEYLAPEVISGQPYSYQVDWWSFGTMLYEMLAGYTPFAGESHTEMYVRVLREPLSFPDSASRGYDPTAWDQDTRGFLRGLLQKDPGLRLQEPRLKRHPYFGMIEWDHIHYRRYIPPYVPHIDPHNQEDTRNFDESFLGLRPNLDFDEDESDDPDADEVEGESPQERARRRRDKDEVTAGLENARLLGQYRQAVAATGDDPAEVDSLFEGYNFTASLESEQGSDEASDEYPNPYAHASMDLDPAEDEEEQVLNVDNEHARMEQSAWDDTSESMDVLPSASSKSSPHREATQGDSLEQRPGLSSLASIPSAVSPRGPGPEPVSVLARPTSDQSLPPKPQGVEQAPKPTYAPGSVKARLAAIEAAHNRTNRAPPAHIHGLPHRTAQSQMREPLPSTTPTLEHKRRYDEAAVPTAAPVPAASKASSSQMSGLVARDFAAQTLTAQGPLDIQQAEQGGASPSALIHSSPTAVSDRGARAAPMTESCPSAPLHSAPERSGLPLRLSDPVDSSAPVDSAPTSVAPESSNTSAMPEWTAAMRRDTATVPDHSREASKMPKVEQRETSRPPNAARPVTKLPAAVTGSRSPQPVHAAMDAMPSYPPSSLERHASTIASSHSRHKPKAPSVSSSIATPIWVPAPAGTTVKIVASSRQSSVGLDEAPPGSTPASPVPVHVPLLHSPPRCRIPSHPLSLRWSLAEAAEVEEYEASALLAAAVLEELERQAGAPESSPPASAPPTVAPAMTASTSMPPASASPPPVSAAGPRPSAATTGLDSSASFSRWTGDAFVSDTGNTTANTGNTTAISTSSHAVHPPRPTSPTTTGKFPPSTLSTSGSLKRALHFRWRPSLGRQESISEQPKPQPLPPGANLEPENTAATSSPIRRTQSISSPAAPPPPTAAPTVPATAESTEPLTSLPRLEPGGQEQPDEPFNAPVEPAEEQMPEPVVLSASEQARLGRSISPRKPTDIVSIAAAAAQASLGNPNVVPSVSFSQSRRESRSIRTSLHSSLHAAMQPDEDEDWDLLDDFDADLLAEGEGERNGGTGLSALTPRVYSSTARSLRKSRQVLYAARRRVAGHPVDEYRLRKSEGKLPAAIQEDDEPADQLYIARSASAPESPGEHTALSPPHPPKRRRPPSSVTAGTGQDTKAPAAPNTPTSKAGVAAPVSFSPTSRPGRKRALYRLGKMISPASLDTHRAASVPPPSGPMDHDEDGDMCMSGVERKERPGMVAPLTSPAISPEQTHARQPQPQSQLQSLPQPQPQPQSRGGASGPRSTQAQRGRKIRRFSLWVCTPTGVRAVTDLSCCVE